MDCEPEHISDINQEPGHLDGPAGADVDFEGIEKSSPLYPLSADNERCGSDPGFQAEDLGINSDGTNPGTEYEGPETSVAAAELPALTDLDEDEDSARRDRSFLLDL